MVGLWQMHFCSLTGLRDDTSLEFRLSGLLDSSLAQSSKIVGA